MIIKTYIKVGANSNNAIQGLHELVKVANTIDIRKSLLDVYVNIDEAVIEDDINKCLGDFISIIGKRKGSNYKKVERLPEPESSQSNFYLSFDRNGKIKQDCYMITI